MPRPKADARNTARYSSARQPRGLHTDTLPEAEGATQRPAKPPTHTLRRPPHAARMGTAAGTATTGASRSRTTSLNLAMCRARTSA